MRRRQRKSHRKENTIARRRDVAMTELLTLIGTLGIILIGIAILLQIVSVEEVSGFMGRAAMALVFTLVALCILKCLWVGVMVPWLSFAFDFLKTLVGWFVIAILGVIALLIVGRVVLRRAGRYLPLRRSPLTGDGYETHDSKEERD
jgi:hypothetical protein